LPQVIPIFVLKEIVPVVSGGKTKLPTLLIRKFMKVYPTPIVQRQDDLSASRFHNEKKDLLLAENYENPNKIMRTRQ
jgi:hypothetical protein